MIPHTLRFFNYKHILVFVAVFLFFLPTFTFAQSSSEKITSFHTEIQVLESGDVLVTEKIQYDFGINQRRGIYREIPMSKVPGATKKIDIELLSVTDESGNSREYLVENNYANQFDVRIGNPDVYLTGEHTYVINYRVKNTIGSFKDFSEIYWNSTGDGWEVSIENTSSRIVLPMIIDASDVQIASYCGESGSTLGCSGSAQVSYIGNTTIIDFSADQPQFLDAYQGMTVAVGFPKGLVAEPHWLLALLLRAWQYIFYPLPLVVGYFWFRKRIKFWREKRTFYNNNPIVTEYDASNTEPMETDAIMHGFISRKGLSAQIIYLAIQGYIIIEKIGAEFAFHGTEKTCDHLPESNKKLLDGLIGKKEKDLRMSFYVIVGEVKTLVQNALLSEQHLFASKMTTKNSSRIFSVFMSVFLAINPGLFIWLLLGSHVGFAFSVSCILVGIIKGIWGPNWAHLTMAGLQQEYKLLGLKRYIGMAEIDRIDFHNDPDKEIETFEKLLPYAMVFGLEKKWAEKFKDIMMNPSWYRGDTGTLHAVMLANSMNTFANQAGQTLTSQPSSGGSFSSGSGGGGSSGGGGGGGGGGSW